MACAGSGRGFVLLAHFGSVPLFAPLTNVVAAPLVALLSPRHLELVSGSDFPIGIGLGRVPLSLAPVASRAVVLDLVAAAAILLAAAAAGWFWPLWPRLPCSGPSGARSGWPAECLGSAGRSSIPTTRPSSS